jgi:hypothetical protein
LLNHAKKPSTNAEKMPAKQADLISIEFTLTSP